MQIYDTPLAGLKMLESIPIKDARGEFSPIFSANEFLEAGLDMQVRATSYSVSQKDVIRGMHFQVPPAQYTKMIYVITGSITDVVVDIRRGSTTYGKHFALEMRAGDGKCIFIPSGFAHGFVSRENNTVVHYVQSREWDPKHYKGISYDSFGYDWAVQNPVVSERDSQQTALADFISPF